MNLYQPINKIIAKPIIIGVKSRLSFMIQNLTKKGAARPPLKLLVKILVSSERQERDVASAFNGYRHLTLMFGAVARNAARQNLSAFGGETTEFSRVLVVYLLDFVDAKRTDFPARATTSFSAHLQSSLGSKRRVVRVNGLAAPIVGVLLRRRVVVALGIAARGLRIVAAFVGTPGSREFDVVNQDFDRIDFDAVLVFVSRRLQSAFDEDTRPLSHVASAEFGGLAKSRHVEKVGDFLLAVGAIDRNAQSRESLAGLRVADFNVTREVARKKNFVHS